MFPLQGSINLPQARHLRRCQSAFKSPRLSRLVLTAAMSSMYSFMSTKDQYYQDYSFVDVKAHSFMSTTRSEDAPLLSAAAAFQGNGPSPPALRPRST